MYSYVFDAETRGYLLTTHNEKYVASEIRPVFAPELTLTGLDRYFKFNRSEKRPLMWGIKNSYYIADIDDKGESYGLKVAQIDKTQYGKPLNIRVTFDGKMKLEPVDVKTMVKKNAKIMDIIVADAKRRTKELYDESINRCDIAYIAFSGGKDSVTLLDICHRVLPLSVPVVFSDTDMELPDTYDVWDEVKKRYPEREFIAAKAKKSATENWKLFGPPSRTIRWCCSVHKSTPALMFLKSKLKKSAIKVMAFVGVRGDESYSRSFYEDATDGVKNASQLNRMPILDWGAHELWLYIFANNLIINCAYKKGISRVGCILCPESSSRYMWFAQKAYPQIVKTYGDIIADSSTKSFSSKDEKNEFISSVDWGARRSGVILKETISAPLEKEDGLNTVFQSPHLNKELFDEWIKTLGKVTKEQGTGRQFLKMPDKLDEGVPFEFKESYSGGIVTFEFHSETERTEILTLIRSMLKKVSACVGCQTCEAQCNFGAISLKAGKIFIDARKCKHCYRCYDISFGCWRFKSMYKSENEQNKMSGINKYNHFGLREDWISALNELNDYFFPWNESHPLGKKMVQSASAWFQQALLIKAKTRKLSPLAALFNKKGSSDILCWEFVWIALANNAILVKWFISETEIGRTYTVEQLLGILSQNYPNLGESTKKDGLTSLKETIARMPLGSNGGIAVCDFKGKTLKSITRKSKSVYPLTILFSLYLIANLADRGSFTIHEMLTANIDSKFVSPLVAFGIAPDIFKRQCEGLRTRYPDYISTTFTHGNDSLEVYPKKHTLEDVIDLAMEDQT